MSEATPFLPTPDTDPKRFDERVIESTNAKVGVKSDGGYVTSWQVRNPHDGSFEDVLYVGSEIKRTGIPILFPNYGESGGKVPMHGFGRDKDTHWTIEQEPGSSKVSMKLNNEAISEAARAKYPYKFEATIKVEAAEDGSLLYSLNVKNLDEKDIPIAPGLHPYWAIPHEDKSKMQTEGVEGFDASSFDWDTNPPDDEYNFNGKAVLKMPRRTITIEDITPGGPVMKKVVAWSQTPEEPDSDFFCLEPVTRGDNALTNNPIHVPKDGEWNMNLKFSSRPIIKK